MDDRPSNEDLPVFTLIYLSMLSSTMLIPAVRPLLAEVHGAGPGAMNAFMGINMVGAVIGAPLLGLLADRARARRKVAMLLCLADAVLLLLCSFPLPLAGLFAVRCLEGAANVGALSVLMGFAGRHRSKGGHGRSMGMAGAAVMAAVATGSPLGTLLMTQGTTAPLWGGAIVALAAAAGCRLLLPRAMPAAAPKRAGLWAVVRAHSMLKWPALWVGVERFTVGCFVVTFALYAHDELGMSDTEVGLHYSWFLLPFAAATYPMGRMTERLPRVVLVVCGGLTYGTVLGGLSVWPTGSLAAALLICGLSSACVYACALCYAAASVAPDWRATSMGVVNAAGSFGMVAGTACAGISMSVLPRYGLVGQEVHAVIFAIAGAAQVLVILASLPALATDFRSRLPSGSSAVSLPMNQQQR